MIGGVQRLTFAARARGGGRNSFRAAKVTLRTSRRLAAAYGL